MPTNNGKPWNASQILHNPARHPRPPTLVTAASAGSSSDPSSKRRASELPLDTEWMQQARREADGVNRIAGIVLLIITLAIGAVVLWFASVPVAP